MPELMPINIPLHNIGQDMDRARATSSEYSMPDLATIRVTLQHIGDLENLEKALAQGQAQDPPRIAIRISSSIPPSLGDIEVKSENISNMNNIGPESNTINHKVCDLISS